MPAFTPWTEDEAELYEFALDLIPPLLVPEVMFRTVTTYTHRPSLRELFTIVAEMLAGPHPSSREAWQVVERLLLVRGVYCLPDPHQPNVFREGEPEFPHRYIAKAVVRMGGWRAICLSEQSMSSLRTGFQHAYDRVIEEAKQKNREALASTTFLTRNIGPGDQNFGSLATHSQFM
jgi:hypothetical protein